MLSDRDRAKISKRAHEKINESRINNGASEVYTAKLGAGQFSQRRHYIVRNSDWVER